MKPQANAFDGPRFLEAIETITESARRATANERKGIEQTILAVNPNGEGRYCPIRWAVRTDGKSVERTMAGETMWTCLVELTLNQDRWYDPKYKRAQPPAISDAEVLRWLEQKGYPFGFLREPRSFAPVDRYSKIYGMVVPIYR